MLASVRIVSNGVIATLLAPLLAYTILALLQWFVNMVGEILSWIWERCKEVLIWIGSVIAKRWKGLTKAILYSISSYISYLAIKSYLDYDDRLGTMVNQYVIDLGLDVISSYFRAKWGGTYDTTVTTVEEYSSWFWGRRDVT